MYDLLSFDGSFEGFLSLLYFAKEKNIHPSNIILPSTPLSLFDFPFYIKTDTTNATLHYQYLKNTFPKKPFHIFNYAFLYETPPLHVKLFEYINIQDKEQLNDIAIEPTKSINKAYKYVLRERHKMLGFLRFSRLQNSIYYAKCAPKSNILVLLGSHFKARFKHEWIIHDIKRNLALLHSDGRLSLKKVESFEEPLLHTEEATCKKLWKKFFTSVAINSRNNPKTQRQFVPLFYRPFMDEFLDN